MIEPVMSHGGKGVEPGLRGDSKPGRGIAQSCAEYHLIVSQGWARFEPGWGTWHLPTRSGKILLSLAQLEKVGAFLGALVHVPAGNNSEVRDAQV